MPSIALSTTSGLSASQAETSGSSGNPRRASAIAGGRWALDTRSVPRTRRRRDVSRVDRDRRVDVGDGVAVEFLLAAQRPGPGNAASADVRRRERRRESNVGGDLTRHRREVERGARPVHPRGAGGDHADGVGRQQREDLARAPRPGRRPTSARTGCPGRRVPAAAGRRPPPSPLPTLAPQPIDVDAVPRDGAFGSGRRHADVGQREAVGDCAEYAELRVAQRAGHARRQPTAGRGLPAARETTRSSARRRRCRRSPRSNRGDGPVNMMEPSKARRCAPARPTPVETPMASPSRNARPSTRSMRHARVFVVERQAAGHGERAGEPPRPAAIHFECDVAYPKRAEPRRDR